MGAFSDLAGRVWWMLVLGCMVATASEQIIFAGGSVRTQRPAVSTTTPPAAVTSDLGKPCQTPDDRQGLCDQYEECPSLKARAKKKDFGYLRSSVCGKHGKLTLLCCPDNAPPPPKPSPSDCGLTHVEPPRIIGGEPVDAVGDFPWMVALSYRGEPVHKCGGAVLSKRWVLTAAHCLTRDGPVGARVGDLNLETTIDDDFLHPPQNIEVDKVFGHPGYKRGFRSPNKGLINDIALIRLKSDIKFSEVVRPICLPNDDSRDQLEGKAVIAGWGLTEFGGVGSIRMLKASVNFTDMETCRSNYGVVGMYVDPRQHTCASGNDTDRTRPGCSPGDDRLECQGGVDACEGDSGGPLMTFEKLDGISRVTVAGLVSFAVGCGNPRYPGIYTRVDNYLDWMEDIMAKNGV